MESIVVHLIEGTTPDKSPRDISTCLSRFMHEMNVNQLTEAIQLSKDKYNYREKKGEHSEIDGYLRSIWTSLLNCATHSSSSVRVAAYSATWSFLMKVMPIYPIIMRNSFSDIVDHFSGESNVSILLISSFAFISHFVSPNKMEEFLDKTPLFHHFIAKESIYSEHLSNIISNLSPHLSHEWFKNLLLAFVKLCKVSNSSTSPNRHILKAIAALIKKNQKLLLPEILVNDEKNVFPGQLSLISFILSSPITSISLYESVSNSSDENSVNLEKLDLKKTAIAAFESIKNIKNRSLVEIDDSFSILSLRSKSFTVTVTTIEENENENENEPKFSITLENYGSCILDDQKAIQRPSFYLLPLPMNLLIPNKQTDSGSIIGIKLKTIGLMISDSDMIQDVDSVIDMLDELCSDEAYNETVSQCLQCLSFCVNSLILNTKSHKLSKLLRKLLFCKTVSWFHAYNILMVIKAIRTDLIPFVLGPSGFRDIIKTVVSFCMNINQDLSRSSFEAIIKLTSDETFYEVTSFVANDIDFFNSFSLQKHLLILSGIIPLHFDQDRSHLRWLFYAVVESINYHIFDIDAAASIFSFFSFFKISKLPEETTSPIIKMAKMILKLSMDIYKNGNSDRFSMSTSSSIGNLESKSNSSITFLNQESLLSSYDANKHTINATFYEIMKNYIETKKTEIVSPKSYDYQIHFIHIYSVMKFLLSLKPSTFRSQKMHKVLLWCFRIFPVDCSYYFALRLKYFNNEQKRNIIKNSYPYLDAIPDMKVHAIWCEIAMLPLNFDDTNFKEFWFTFIRSMFETVRFYAKNQKEKKISLNAIIKFAYFLGFIKSRYSSFSINVDKLAKEEKIGPNEEKNKVFSKYLLMFLSKLSDIKKIQFLQNAENDMKFSSNFPDITYDITAKYKVPKLDNSVHEMLGSFNNLIEPQKKLLLNELSKPSSKLPPKIPDNVINYSREKLYGWSLLSFYKKCLKVEISSSLKSEINVELNVEPRAFNPVCQQSIIKEDPQKKLQLFSNMNSIISIKTVLCLVKESFDKDPTLIDFSAISFTQSMIPFVAKFIKKAKEKLKNNNPNIFEKAEKKLETEMHLIKYFFNPNLKFELETNQRKLTKELIYRICHFMQEFRMTIVGIEQEILSCLKETHSFNRTKALLTLASVHISILGTNLHKYLSKNSEESQLNKIGIEINNFVEHVFIILKSKIEDTSNHPSNAQQHENHTHHYLHNNNIIPQKELLNFALAVNNFQMHFQNICLKEDSNNNDENSCNIKVRRKSLFGLNAITTNIFSKNDDNENDDENKDENDEINKSSLEKYISFVDRYCNLYVFPDCLTLHLKYSPRIKFVESINDIILNSNHPSFILQSIRALRCLVAVGDIATIRFHINDYLTKFHHLQGIYPISYYVSYLLVDIVGGSGQFNIQSSILLPNGETVSTGSDQTIVVNNDSNDQNSTEAIKQEMINNNSNKIMHSSPNLLASVANTTNLAVLASIRNSITSELFHLILVPISRASFYPLAKVIVALIDSETNPKNKYYMRLIKECEKIIEDGITSFLHFKLYLEILTARIRKIPEKSDKEVVAKDSVTKLVRIYRNGISINNIMKNVYNDKIKEVKVDEVPTFDSYFIDDYLNVILRLMNEFMSFDDMILHFVLTVLPSVPRFFPSFVAIAKILKQAKKKSDGYDKCIEEANKLLSPMQSNALDLILKGPMSNDILKLAEGTVETKPI